MSKQQNFNNLLRYIKRKFGAPLNLFELTDDDIYDIVIEDVLPPLSQYIGKPAWLLLKSSDLKPYSDQNRSYNVAEIYTIPIPKDITIVDVQEVYWPQYGTIGTDGELLYGLGGFTDPRDTVMANTFMDMNASLEIVPTFRFIPPKTIMFDTTLNGKSTILECKAEHSDLSTIPSDIYYEIIRPLALAEVLENIAAIRSKYKVLNTPFGVIELNPEELKSRADQIHQTIQEKLDALPPDILVSWM